MGIFILLATIALVQRSQFRISRQLPINEVKTVTEILIPVRGTDHLDNATKVVPVVPVVSLSEVPDIGITTNVTRPWQQTAVTESRSSTTVYKLPKKPIHNIYSILKQSIGSAIIQNTKKNPLRNCQPTSQFQLQSTIQQRVNNIDTLEYTIQAMMMEVSKVSNNNNNTKQPIKMIPKRQGGDEIYVEWVSSTDPFEMGIAMITDQNDGTYHLKFVRPPILQKNYTTKNETPNVAPIGTITIYYDYTCGIGSMFAPDKDQFRRAGEVHLSFNHSNIPKPYIHDFIPPNVATKTDQKKLKIDLSKYDTVIAFGDSLMLQLVRQYRIGGFWSRNIRYEENINQCLSNVNDTESALQKFNQWHGQQIMDATELQPKQSIAVIVGSAVWDAMRGCVRSDFQEHRNAIRQFITTLRMLYPQIHLYWKSPSAIILHRRNSLEELIGNKIWLHRSRYISDGVPRRIYAEQKALMKELQVPFLDLFDAYYLSAPWTLPGDARHYEDDISFLLLSYYWPGLNATNTYYIK
jgi:hypothetical protein